MLWSGKPFLLRRNALKRERINTRTVYQSPRFYQSTSNKSAFYSHGESSPLMQQTHNSLTLRCREAPNVIRAGASDPLPLPAAILAPRRGIEPLSPDRQSRIIAVIRPRHKSDGFSQDEITENLSYFLTDLLVSSRGLEPQGI